MPFLYGVSHTHNLTISSRTSTCCLRFPLILYTWFILHCMTRMACLYTCGGSRSLPNHVPFPLGVTLGCIGKYGKNWLLNPRTSSQSEGYSNKWLVCGEPLNCRLGGVIVKIVRPCSQRFDKLRNTYVAWIRSTMYVGTTSTAFVNIDPREHDTLQGGHVVTRFGYCLKWQGCQFSKWVHFYRFPSEWNKKFQCPFNFPLP